MSVLGNKSSVATSTAASECTTSHAGKKLTILSFSMLALAAATSAVASNAGNDVSSLCGTSTGQDALDASHVEFSFGSELQTAGKKSSGKKSSRKSQKSSGKKRSSEKKRVSSATSAASAAEAEKAAVAAAAAAAATAAETEKNNVLNTINKQQAEKAESGEAGRKWMLNRLWAISCLVGLIHVLCLFLLAMRYNMRFDMCIFIEFLCGAACAYGCIVSDKCCCKSTLLSKDSWIAHKWEAVKADVQKTDAAKVDASVASSMEDEFENTNWDFCARCCAMSCCERASMCWYALTVLGVVCEFINIGFLLKWIC